ncbi:hypothetical protein SFR_0787 [Streptomyces sp. FR-008]|nr:hypothetical protein SFR_0787 [Streptomyces sp. FR-008]
MAAVRRRRWRESDIRVRAAAGGPGPDPRQGIPLSLDGPARVPRPR